MQQYNDRATVHLRNLSSDVDEDLLFELGVQFGEVVRVTLPVNKLTQQREEFGFIEFASPADAQYMRDVIHASVAPLRLFGKTVQLSYKGDKPALDADCLLDIGARIVVSNLNAAAGSNPEALRVHFSQFGRLAVPPAMSREGGGTFAATVSFTSFDASDAAIRATHQQFLFGSKVRAEYAMRLDGKGRHGTVEERQMYAATAGGGAAPATGPAFVPRIAPMKAATGQPDWASGMNPYGAK